MEKKKFYITTAIAYPNGKPHMGHALEIVEADAIARFYRLIGEEVWFQTGTDEHGIKNWQTAQKEGIDVHQFLDRNVEEFKKLYASLNISYDNFIRTTDQKTHYVGATKLWKEIAKSGDLYKQKYSGLYCVGCESFKTEKELVDGKCVHHPTREIEKVEEENYFFKLSNYKEILIDVITRDEYKIVPETRKNEILSFLREARDISFSRPKTTLPWGIPVPDDEDHVMYVWCDALSNYITGAGYGTDNKMFEKTWPANIHIVGKDILRFHAGIWPAMLLSAKIALPKKLFVHGFMQMSGTKMGKSTGNVIDPSVLIKEYGTEQFRFYILSSMPMDGDGEYSEDTFIEKVNNELVANIANFCYRTLSYTHKALESTITEIDEDKNVMGEITKKIDLVIEAYKQENLKEAITLILEISSIGNKYMQEKEPWKLIKEDVEKTRKVMGTCMNIAKIISILLTPIMPVYSEQIRKQLNLEGACFEDLNFETKHHKIGQPQILLTKIEKKIVEKKFPLDLRVAQIKEIRDHPDADKLFVMKIDVGEERSLVAGLRKHYTAEELLGRKIILVSNLKPAKLRGFLSQGMLLAANDGENVRILEVKNAAPGTKIIIEGYENNTSEIEYSDFEKIKMTTKNEKVVYNDVDLKADGEEVFSTGIKDNAKIS